MPTRRSVQDYDPGLRVFVSAYLLRPELILAGCADDGRFPSDPVPFVGSERYPQPLKISAVGGDEWDVSDWFGFC